jgi:hypothetical protein
LESFTLKNRSPLAQSFCAQFLCGLLIAIVTLGLASCGQNLYKFPQYTFANRPIPPSKLANRVMVGITANGTQGSLEILDGNRDIRSNVQNTIKSFQIAGYSGGFPNLILNFPEQVRGYVYSDSDGSLSIVDYGKESSSGSGGAFPAKSSAIAIPPTFAHVYSAEESIGQFGVIDNTTGKSYGLNLPNVYKVAVNDGDTVVLAMVRNSNTLYRLLKLNANQPAPPGAVDCQPVNLPVYCVVPVPDSASNPSLDRPVGAYFSLDGTTAYILDCGPECGGKTAGLTLIQQGLVTVDVIPKSLPYVSPVTTSIPVPGGATVSVSSGTTLYLAGQQQLSDGLFTGFLSTVNLANNTVTGKYGISDGYHTKLLFADDNTLWVGSQLCANGERAKQGTNYNCLTRFDLGANTAQIIPNVTPGGTTTVPFPNGNLNPYYYGDLTGLCWVQNLHKIYTAYGGQVHAFNTSDGSEIDNFYITVQGTALDVAYMDAITNAAN